MRIARTIAELSLDRSQRVALVPTMGAFHEGHLHLMRRAREIADVVVVSLFVNPTQFGAGEDFESYPRNEQRDFALAKQVGVDVMFAPARDEMYLAETRNEERGTRNERGDTGGGGAAGAQVLGRGERETRNEERGTRNEPADLLTTVHVPGLSELWEGAFRTGHFDGVATVVAKLFNIVRPNVALFGLKDFQQCRVIEQMVHDLNFPIDLQFEETIREADGLAMSSRNAYLNAEERAKAPMLYQALMGIARAAASGESIDTTIEGGKGMLVAAGFQVEYLELVSSATLKPERSDLQKARVIVAARLGTTRLIDNVAV